MDEKTGNPVIAERIGDQYIVVLNKQLFHLLTAIIGYHITGNAVMHNYYRKLMSIAENENLVHVIHESFDKNTAILDYEAISKICYNNKE